MSDEPPGRPWAVRIARVLLIALVALPVARAAERPNVLMIAIDDLKPLLGCYGMPRVVSPHIDALAARGTVFLNAHCQQAVCGPSRASLLTGLRPDTTRVWDLKTQVRDNLPDVVTLPQHFKNNGYESVGIGKVFDPRSVDGRSTMDRVSWSRPYVRATSPSHDTFGYRNPETVGRIEAGLAHTRAEGIDGWRETQAAIGHKPPTDSAVVADDAYDDGAVATAAVRLIEELAAGDTPFFLAVGFKKPHLPFCAPRRYWDLYDADAFELASPARLPDGAPSFHFQDSMELRGGYTGIPAGPLPDVLQRELIHGYHACVSYVDAQVGRLIAALADAGVAENTVVVLWGDHGWHLGDHGMWCKHTNYEQATRVPLVIVAPRQKRAGGRAKAPVELIDIFPTLCELTHLQLPPDLEGQSLAAALDDPTAAIKPAAVSQYPRQRPDGELMGYAFRTERYRFIQWFPFDPASPNSTGGRQPVATELYDYETDPAEIHNLADDPGHRAAREEMVRLAEAYWRTRRSRP
jgi:iduronate 2-sulfatase